MPANFRWSDRLGRLADGDLDVVAAGSNNAAFVTQVYRNDGGSVFTDIGAALTNLSSGRVAWGDYDNDGDLDLLLAGLDAAFQRIAEVYRNDGGLFTEIGAGLIGVFNHSMAWGDYDNDDDLDFLLTGCNAPTANGCTYYISFLYRNNALIPNTLPTAPSDLGASVEGTIATLHWNPASDVQTPASGLTYNLRVGTTPGGGEIVSPQAITATGCRLLPQFGNVSHGLTATLTNLSPGVYYWSAQAIDSMWAGSAFATEGSFTLPPPPPPTPIPGDLYLPLIQRASDNPVAPGC